MVLALWTIDKNRARRGDGEPPDAPTLENLNLAAPTQSQDYATMQDEWERPSDYVRSNIPVSLIFL